MNKIRSFGSDPVKDILEIDENKYNNRRYRR